MNPELLCHPNIPKPLHGISPRKIYGKDWWDAMRRVAYHEADYKCEACGIKKENAWPHAWLEAHETYDYNYKSGVLTFLKLVAICPACHMFIHSGRTEILLDCGEIHYALYSKIMRHGRAVLKKNKLSHRWEERHNTPCSVSWENWRMVIHGISYGPSSLSQWDWMDGSWEEWEPVMNNTISEQRKLLPRKEAKKASPFL